MTLTIPDDVMKQAGLTEREVLVELACRLYDAGKLSKAAAMRVAGVDRASFEDELLKRGLPWVRITAEVFPDADPIPARHDSDGTQRQAG